MEGKENPSSSERKDPLVYAIEEKLSARIEPLLLLESAGLESCCIFNVPDRLSEANPDAYAPKLVSIGPCHHGKEKLQMIQQHKLRFLQLFINEARKHGMENSYVMMEALLTRKEDIRKSYSMQLRFDDDKLISMMILDGIFILTLLLIKSKLIEFVEDVDPIFASSWILPAIRIDLLLLENQVPFFVLKTLFQQSRIHGMLIYLALDFFNLSLCYGEEFWNGYQDLCPLHLLDLLRETFLPRQYKPVILSPSCCHNCLGSCLYCRRSSGYTSQMISSAPKRRLRDSSLILPAKKLRLKGIHIKLRSYAESMLEIGLKDNNVLIPMLRIDGFVSSFLLNCVTFEQLYSGCCRSTHITSYVVFMGNLLHSEEDADFLSNHKRIIENYLGDENEVFQFFKTITKNVVFDLDECYLKDVYEG